MSTQVYINSSEYTKIVIPITSEQIRALGTNPVKLLEEPGAGKYYIINQVILEYTFNNVAYIVPSSPTIYLDGCFDSYIDISFLTSVTNSVCSISGNLRNTITVGSGSGSVKIITNKDILNTPLIIGTTNGDNPRTGEGTLNVIIEYKIVKFI